MKNSMIGQEGANGKGARTNRDRFFVQFVIAADVKTSELIKRRRARKVTRLCIGTETEDECAPSPRAMLSGFRSKSRHLVRSALCDSRNSKRHRC